LDCQGKNVPILLSIFLSILLLSNAQDFSQVVLQLVVLMEDAEHMEIGVMDKSFLIVQIITTQLVSAAIVVKLLIAMLLLQMQDHLMLA